MLPHGRIVIANASALQDAFNRALGGKTKVVASVINTVINQQLAAITVMAFSRIIHISQISH